MNPVLARYRGKRKLNRANCCGFRLNHDKPHAARLPREKSSPPLLLVSRLAWGSLRQSVRYFLLAFRLCIVLYTEPRYSFQELVNVGKLWKLRYYATSVCIKEKHRLFPNPWSSKHGQLPPSKFR